jgi:hypothetical protein
MNKNRDQFVVSTGRTGGRQCRGQDYDVFGLDDSKQIFEDTLFDACECAG